MSVIKQETKDIIKKTMSLSRTNENGSEYSNLYKRFEKIAAAFYLVTNHLSDTDPLKKDMREKTIGLLNLVSDLLTKSYITSVMAKDKIEAQCAQLVSLLSMSAQAGIITTTNSQIIDTEIKKTLVMFDNLFHKDGFDTTLGGNFFGGVSLDAKREQGIIDDIKDNYQGIYKRQIIDHAGNEKHEYKTRGVDALKRTDSVSVKEYDNGNGNGLKPRKKNRRDFILSVISQKGEVTIKDISSVFKGCSEKTIQRELIALVNDGVVSKEGERRWSRYKLS
ncbi:MAG: hypothetical protein COV34_00605 [Candidatus Zambryskibacteria bacterium CG10_big_fil_rev_8_21_14_0_10_42_12]|uniref:Uncharacterized protein n=1 Tax=Candidatus Zambryskibacteria bacterium CG10_big_fil_rev_8_21_14_0_10_42_12 TaxID=1975115 RepID=A0A2H0QXT9_9BACT|nr:MAG: hypothetical protein COV34_00605 [Candidatus Zambryskibacteria bacterium CG10_big_fil_rev_8_21_14_0_10_42_12]